MVTNHLALNWLTDGIVKGSICCLISTEKVFSSVFGELDNDCISIWNNLENSPITNNVNVILFKCPIDLMQRDIIASATKKLRKIVSSGKTVFILNIIEESQAYIDVIIENDIRRDILSIIPYADLIKPFADKIILLGKPEDYKVFMDINGIDLHDAFVAFHYEQDHFQRYTNYLRFGLNE